MWRVTARGWTDEFLIVFREEVFARIEKILGELLQHESTNEAAEAWKEDAWLPSKMAQTAVTHLYKLLLAKVREGLRLEL